MNKSVLLVVGILWSFQTYAQNFTGNVGIFTTTPQTALQIGNFTTSNSNAVVIPGTYNFEQVRLGQYGNGAVGLELINHASASLSYGIKFLANVDQGAGLQIQYAPQASSYGSLGYSTAIFVDCQYGNVGINTTNTKGYKLAVNGSVVATAMVIKLNANWPDYVFSHTYKLRTLGQVRDYIKANRSLPEMPSEKDVKEKGLDIGEINKLLTKKVEELTLYLIEKERQLNNQERQLNNQERSIKSLVHRIDQLEQTQSPAILKNK